MGGNKTVTTTAERINTIQIQKSTYGLPVSLIYGQTKVPGNVIDYTDFKAIANSSSTRSGKGGSATVTNVTYSYTAALDIGLCEGDISIVKAFIGDNEKSLSDLGLTKFYREKWPYMETNHPDRALAYPISHVAGVIDLTSSATVQNYTFEVKGLKSYSSSIPDANPAEILDDFLSNSIHGAGIASKYIGDLTNYSNYCVANGIFLSPALTEQTEARQFIDQLLKTTNSEIIWSQGKFKVIPRGDETVIGNGVTFTPDLVAKYDPTDDDFITTGKEAPVRFSRGSTSDAYNNITIEFVNRDNKYAIETVPAKDQANIEDYGLRTKASEQMHFITQKSIARIVAQIVLQKNLYIRNKYTFKLGYKYARLEPMDIVTITDTILNLNKYPVRITEVEEQDDGTFAIKAEDFPAGISSSASYSFQSTDRNAINRDISPGSVSQVFAFDAPKELTTANQPEIWMGVCGANSATWGGCNVWASDDDETYTKIGRIAAPSRVGTLSAILPASSTSPDTSNTLAVIMGYGELNSGTQQDADNLNTLCWVDGEFLAYRTATLTGTGQYNLTYLVRGAYNTDMVAHSQGSGFVRMDDTVFKYPYTTDKIGKTLYLKFTSFNVFGRAEESLDVVDSHEVMISPGAPDTPDDLSVTASPSGFILNQS